MGFSLSLSLLRAETAPCYCLPRWFLGHHRLIRPPLGVAPVPKESGNSSSHPDQSHPLEPPVIAENAKIRPVLTQNSRSSISLLWPPIQTSKVSRGVGYPSLRQTPYVALVVPAYGEIM
ncbi:organic cation/carnitine transporter 3 [Prunus dulcis]|uniref:Organic cation/carnitine transporter 3 n=1 Tax=Prunus dulcis TaxID=3755 RepID=A0A5H2XMX2_PRUDU|nr:organic cation/carnitine transporter 3 [Prunus dulcis]